MERSWPFGADHTAWQCDPTYNYNAYGKVTAERDELGRITRYEYGENLQLVSRRINPDGSELHSRCNSYDNAQYTQQELELIDDLHIWMRRVGSKRAEYASLLPAEAQASRDP